MRIKVRKGYQFFRANNISVGGGATITDATEQEVSTQRWKVEILDNVERVKKTDIKKEEVVEDEKEEVHSNEVTEEEISEEESLVTEEGKEDPETDNKNIEEAPNDRAVKKTKRKSRK